MDEYYPVSTINILNPVNVVLNKLYRLPMLRLMFVWGRRYMRVATEWGSTVTVGS